ncbi:MAG: hypothetical protein M3O15_08025, partial [Acidobacteriota bacterium]|nr:hypothetical protein [Acidobacteriota bacterium]
MFGVTEPSISRRPGWRWRSALLWLAILLTAAAVRLPTVTAGLPYLNYVDEGHVLHRVVHLLATGDWDPHWYIYPAFPNYAIAFAARLYSPLYAAVHGRPLAPDLSREPAPFY